MKVALASQPLAEDWKDMLGLSTRRAPEIYSNASAVDDVPHAGPIRTALRDLGADSVFCIQNVPTVVFFAAEDAEPENIAPLHSNLWNQGLATVLAVVRGDTIRIYSLAAVPPDRHRNGLDDHCLVEVLHKIKDAIKVRSLIYGMESGRYWREHDDRFDPNQRVDGVLLGNLKESDRRLRQSGLQPEASQALLMQTMFIAYLEDRDIIGASYIKDATDHEFSGFSDILDAQKVTAFYALFRSLNQDISGDLFVKPCSFDTAAPRLLRDHLPTLADFRAGMYEMGPHTDQGRLWAYDFKFIPVELISAVYDQFLSTEDRVPRGQFHTPMHLATSVVSQLWDDPQFLTQSAKTHHTILDPACGSGIFLACMFKRLCERWRQRKHTKKIQWRRLCDILDQLTGLDIDSRAVRVAIFSLYIALLEEVDPPDIRRLMAHRKLLPQLLGSTLRKVDFFDLAIGTQYDVVIGNPPWRASDQGAADWCLEHRLPVPNKQAAWGFVWKSIQHLKEGGKLAFLLPAMPFLHTHSKRALEARFRLFRDIKVSRIVNYADLCHQLFPSAKHPAALLIGGGNPGDAPYRFDYWVPKAPPSFGTTKMLTISDEDKNQLDTKQLTADPLVFKNRLWMTGPEDKLFRYVKSFPSLRTKVTQFKHIRSKKNDAPTGWIIGQGFKRARADHVGDENYDTVLSDVVPTLPFLPSRPFQVISPDLQALTAPQEALVHRPGFEQGFYGPRILVPQGTATSRLRAAYSDVDFTFRHAIQAIVVPESDKDRAKVLAAMLNSKLMFWFALHASSSIGSERPKVHQDQLLDLPFPAPDDMPEAERAHTASAKLVALMDEVKAQYDADVHASDLLDFLWRIDGLVYDYFGLSEQEILLVEDAVDYIAPSMQPKPNSSPPIWRQTTAEDRRAYALVFVSALSDWKEPDREISVALISRDDDLAVVRLRLSSRSEWAEYEEQDLPLGGALAAVSTAMNAELPGNLHQLGNLRVYAGDDLYMVKPNRMRFWTRTAARVDAEQIVVDLWH